MPSPQAPAEAKTEKPESVNEDSQLSQDDSTSEGGIISHLPPKQRELFLRIQAQQKKNTVENQADDSENQGRGKRLLTLVDIRNVCPNCNFYV